MPIEEKAKFDGKVKNVAREFLVRADEGLAHKLQNEEYLAHYDKNRAERKHVRTDIPVAKNIQNCEYEELLKKHKLLEQIEQEDSLIALEYHKKFLIEEVERRKLREKEDERLARKLQMKLDIRDNGKKTEIFDAFSKTPLTEQEEKDYKLAQLLQEEEKKTVNDTDGLNVDERLARRLQREEEFKYENDRKRQLKEQEAKTARFLSKNGSQIRAIDTTQQHQVKRASSNDKTTKKIDNPSNNNSSNTTSNNTNKRDKIIFVSKLPVTLADADSVPASVPGQIDVADKRRKSTTTSNKSNANKK